MTVVEGMQPIQRRGLAFLLTIYGILIAALLGCLIVG